MDGPVASSKLAITQGVWVALKLRYASLNALMICAVSDALVGWTHLGRRERSLVDEEELPIARRAARALRRLADEAGHDDPAARSLFDHPTFLEM